MIKQLSKNFLNEIKSSELIDYAKIYLKREESFLKEISNFGLEISTEKPLDLENKNWSSCGVKAENNCSSFVRNYLSPSCYTCRKGMGTITFFISLNCPKNCYFCFNPNQENYEHFLRNERDLSKELRSLHASGAKYTDIALTGGEPLLHKDMVREFFSEVKKLYPKAYTRLYTSGFDLDTDMLADLQVLGLDEIRFSIKMEDEQKEIDILLDTISEAKKYIKNVMVEMPIMPDNLEEMKALLLRLDEIKISGINLLELCFPYNNADEFKKRGYQIKSKQFRVLYNYWYAGGLPIAGSEENCVALLEFAAEKNLALGVHYCSLENKQSGQIYRQNHLFKTNSPPLAMSERDFFLKSLKAFGNDAEKLQSYFTANGLRNFRMNDDYHYIEFPVSYAGKVKKFYPNCEMILSYSVVEKQGAESLVKELTVAYTTAETFNPKTDF